MFAGLLCERITGKDMGSRAEWREKLNCDVLERKASTDPMGRPEAGMAITTSNPGKGLGPVIEYRLPLQSEASCGQPPPPLVPVIVSGEGLRHKLSAGQYAQCLGKQEHLSPEGRLCAEDPKMPSQSHCLPLTLRHPTLGMISCFPELVISSF